MYRRSILLAILLTSVSAKACPDLRNFLPGSDPAWSSLSAELEPLFDQCLTSSQYFSLRGAAQLNSGRLAEAIESLERALLLDPDNGAALVDYAQALLEDGQLFAAIEANQLALSRDGIPPGLHSQLEQRQRDWALLTRRTSYQIDLVGGYDDNLNGGPDEDRVALTLAGEPIFLSLNQNLLAASGSFLNMRGLLRHQRLMPRRQHNFLGQLSGRLSNDRQSDVLQLSTRYSQILSHQQSSSLMGAGLNHLTFGGKSLFTGIDTRYRYQFARGSSCMPFVGGAIQHQTWHGQELLNGVESKLSLGGDCAVASRRNQRVWLESGLLYNSSQNSDRLGGDRVGRQFRIQWQVSFEDAVVSAQFDHTALEDRRGYSQLLAGNARRRISRNSLLVQYRKRLRLARDGADFVMTFYHQDQSSNLTLFSTSDTSLEIGMSWRF